MQGSEEDSDSGCFACCWNLCLLLFFLFAWYFLRLWRSQFQVLPAWRDQPQPPPQGHKETGPEGPQDGDSARSHRRRSIRRLLCDSPTCSLCQRAAEEAAELAYPTGLDPGRCRARAPLLLWPSGAKCLRPARKPPPDCGLCPLNPAGHPAGLPHKERGPKSIRHRFCRQEGGCVSRASQEESSHGCTTSSVLEASFSSWTECTSSTGSTASWRRGACRYSQRVEESEVASSSTERTCWDSKGGRRRRRKREGGSHCSRCHRRKSRRSTAARGVPPAHGVVLETPSLGKEAWASLERHLLRKRLQHTLGLPSVLLHSLRASVPLAPSPPARRKPPENMVLALRPQPLPFLRPPAAREGLEKHLKKMVSLRRWGLPQRVQDTLRHLRPSSRPCAEHLPPAAPKAGRLPSRRDLSPPSPRSLQREAGPLEMAYGRRKCRGATLLGPRTKKGPGTPDGGVILPWMGTTEALEAHALKKRLQHQWGLPGLVQLSLKQFLPALPKLTAIRPSTRPFLWGGNTPVVAGPLPFLPRETQELLEIHLRRRLVQREWGLPQRVLKSLRVFLPPSPPWAERPQEKSPSPRRTREGRAASARPPPPFRRLQGTSRGPESHADPNGHLLEGHLAKKGLEIQLGTLPSLPACLQAAHLPTGKLALPKVIPPRQRGAAARLRRTDLLFVDPATLSRLELNVALKRLAYAWGLPTLYTQSLAHFSLGIAPPRACLGPCANHHPGRVTFVATEARFVTREKQEGLEWHVKKKQVQHLWGLPGLVLRSLRHLLPQAPRLPQRGRGHGTVAILRSPLSCLGRETQQKLEAHVRKSISLQRWGLPGRVLRSLRRLLPELGSHRHPLQGPWGKEPRPHLSGHAPLDKHFQRASGTREAQPPRKRKVASMLAPKDLQRLKRHLRKRVVEVQLRAVPLLARISWQLAQLEPCCPLPRLRRPGQGTRLPRRRFLPFLRAEDIDRMELAIFRRHLSFLWGLAPRSVGGLAGLRVARLSPPPLRPRATAIVFSEAGTPFLAQSARGALEQHLRQKRAQHAWGVPAFLQRSLRAFMPASSPRPIGTKSTIQVSVLRQEALLLPKGSHHLLETHVQRRKRQRLWGLPGRVLHSLKTMCPKPRRLASSQAGVPRSHPQALAGSSHRGPPGPWSTGTVSRGPGIQRAKRRRVLVPAAPPPVLLLKGTRDLEVIGLRLAKKYTEEQLGAFPALVQRSRQEASPWAQKRLPKLILPGQRPLRARRVLPPFGRKEDLERIELTIQCHYLMSLSLLGARCAKAPGGTISRTTSAPPFQPRGPAAAFVLADGQLLFLQAQAKEALEEHVKKKRIQHMWGIPVAVQRSLRSLVDKPPPAASLSQKATLAVRVQRREMSFFPPPVRRHLELHLLKRKYQRLWGLPGRILQSLKAFASPRSRRLESRAPSSHGRQGRPRSKGQDSQSARGHASCPDAALGGPVPQGAAVQTPGKKGPGRKHKGGSSLPHP
ncbi:hypothetical protein JRQ81_013056 [Phrynocephalus forsythii]|uniref:SPATA31 domain-containing protein n=1 Tax=Phrynocephalus forsythii TaxID=171643 RepID=A0A9Q1B4E1_9SAUR|nr:hypothetical protein JRQ81_013056 [Phrynocephalus forsythii]